MHQTNNKYEQKHTREGERERGTEGCKSFRPFCSVLTLKSCFAADFIAPPLKCNYLITPRVSRDLFNSESLKLSQKKTVRSVASKSPTLVWFVVFC